MHRLLMLSNTYQMSAMPSREALEMDPDNRLWSRFAARRLTAEEVRDSLLAVDGSLDLTAKLNFAGEGGRRGSVDEAKDRRRSVYLPLLRNQLPRMMDLFDFVDSATSTGKRPESNVAPQALFAMNSDFVRERARSFAKHLLSDGSPDDAARIQRAYRMALTRDPAAGELQENLNYLTGYPRAGAEPADSWLEAWQSLCHVLLASNEFHYVE
jgi:hypothetical protein